MKKHFFTIIFILSIFIPGTPKAHATLPVANVPGVVADITAQITRIGQFGTETVGTAANTNTSIQTTLATVKKNVLDPIKDAMTLVTIAKSGDQIKNLVLGSLGEESLLITNPKSYLKNKANDSVRESLNSVSKSDGLFSDSIANDIIQTTRAKNDIQGQIASLTKSSASSIIQKKICDDAVLTKTAVDDVMKSDGTNDLTKIKARKAELNSKLCVGDPSTNKQLAANLTVANKQTNAGGWDLWLDSTGNGNTYAQKTKAVDLVAQQTAKVETDQAKQLEQGKGIADKVTCNVPLQVDLIDSSKKFCPEGHNVIQNLGSQLSESYKSAINAPLDTLKSSYGSGAFSLFSDVVSIMGSAKNLSNALSSGGGGSNSTVSDVGGPANTSTVTNATPDQDLTDNSKQKDQLVNPSSKQLSTHLTALSKLEGFDNQYLSEIDSHSSSLEGIKSCYDKLVTDFPKDTTINSSVSDDPRFIGDMNFYTSEKNSDSDLKEKITNELNLISTTRTLITDTQNIMKTSNSSQEILDAFNSYQNRVDNENLPSSTVGIEREGELANYKQNNKSELDNQPDANYYGKITAILNDCSAIRRDEVAKRDNNYYYWGRGVLNN